eukprot:CAMPEP_0184869980 /NCGR_PEP_ID=MMETSP0580-20130426/36052_1 /TAXON_ID=1118495 /ORGANISM="Dactyliosolen fragilissimus" /LENGTH=211 /DNA_ID=CAMNT_0027371833 /DNA_START=351 /DNA_END=983 /DNA_ORIENTATION=-
MQSHQSAKQAIILALDIAKVWVKDQNHWYQDQNFPERRVLSLPRNILPEWLVLMLLIGKCGKKHLDLLVQSILDSLFSDGSENTSLPIILLFLYANFPSKMALNNAKIRNTLVEASRSIGSEWLRWRSSLDEQLEDAIRGLMMNPIQRQQQYIFDICKRHPLLVMRQIGLIKDILKNDADVVSKFGDENRFRFFSAPKNTLYAVTTYGVSW